MPRTVGARERFAGFDRDAPGFFHELAMEMNRDWFEANKPRYAAQWVQPMTTLLGEVAARLVTTYAPIRLHPPRLFRISRDTRFSKDKSPYKTHIAGWLPLHRGSPSTAAARRCTWSSASTANTPVSGRTSPTTASSCAGASSSPPMPPARRSPAWIDKLRRAGYRVGGHDDYKRVPRGLPPDHPRGELLKMRGLTAGFEDIPRGLLHKPALVDWLVARCQATAPLVTWLHRKLT